MNDQRFAVAGSTPRQATGGEWLAADPNLEVTATILIRRQHDAQNLAESVLAGTFSAQPRSKAESALSADPADLEAVRGFVSEYGLAVVSENPVARSIKISGTIQQMDRAFQVDIQWHADDKGRKYLSHQEPIRIPEKFKGIVEAVLGLDQRPVASPRSNAL